MNQDVRVKKCSKCQEVKSIIEFHKKYNTKDGLCCWCKKCNNQDNLQRYFQNRIKYKTQMLKRYYETRIEQNKKSREWHKYNKEKCNKLSLLWYYNNIERSRNNKNKWNKQKRKNDPNFRLLSSVRIQMANGLKMIRKSKHTLQYVDLTIDELWRHFESRFTPIMTRENYGKVWQIDHIIPVSFFNLNDIVERQQCYHWTNLQPLDKTENVNIKKDRIDHPTQLCKNLPLCV